MLFEHLQAALRPRTGERLLQVRAAKPLKRKAIQREKARKGRGRRHDPYHRTHLVPGSTMSIPRGSRAGTSRDAPDASRHRGALREAARPESCDPPHARRPIQSYHIPPASVCKMPGAVPDKRQEKRPVAGPCPGRCWPVPPIATGGLLLADGFPSSTGHEVRRRIENVILDRRLRILSRHAGVGGRAFAFDHPFEGEPTDGRQDPDPDRKPA